ncbi:hypothetical protein [Maribacter aestuarii]|nr:hypothetical protein [Maribacter aestuarii]
MKNLHSTKTINIEDDKDIKKMFDNYNKNLIAIGVFSTIQFVFLISIL